MAALYILQLAFQTIHFWFVYKLTLWHKVKPNGSKSTEAASTPSSLELWTCRYNGSPSGLTVWAESLPEENLWHLYMQKVNT